MTRRWKTEKHGDEDTIIFVIQSDIHSPYGTGFSFIVKPSQDSHNLPYDTLGVRTLLHEYKYETDQPRNPNVTLSLDNSANLLLVDYQPHNLHLFSLFDDLSKVGDCYVSYDVVGWWADRTQDPFNEITASMPADTQTELFNAAMKRLNMQLPAGVTPTFPCRLLVSGQLKDIHYRMDPDDDDTSITPIVFQSLDSIQLAVANTASEALNLLFTTSFLPNASPSSFEQWVKVLNAMTNAELDTLDGLDGERLCDAFTHRTAFRRTKDYSKYAIKPSKVGTAEPLTDSRTDPSLFISQAAEAPNGNSDDSNNTLPPLPLSVALQLDQLNSLSIEVSQRQRLVKRRQWDLSVAWWRHNTNQSTDEENYLKECMTELVAQQKTLVDKASAFDGLITSLNQWAASQSEKLSLVDEPAESFFQHEDPVLLMTNVGNSWPDKYTDPLVCSILKPDLDAPPVDDWTRLDPDMQPFAWLLVSNPAKSIAWGEVQPWFPLLVDYTLRWTCVPFNQFDAQGRRWWSAAVRHQFVRA